MDPFGGRMMSPPDSYTENVSLSFPGPLTLDSYWERINVRTKKSLVTNPSLCIPPYPRPVVKEILFYTLIVVLIRTTCPGVFGVKLLPVKSSINPLLGR